MPTYTQNSAASDVSPFTDGNRQMGAAGGNASFATGNIAAGTSDFHGFITSAGVPNSDTWEDSGAWTADIEIDSGDADMDARVRAVRIDAAGNVLQVGGWTGFQALDVTRAFAVTAPAWTDGEEACDNRLAVEIEFACTAPHGNCNVTVGLGTAANEVVTDITEDTAGCAATVMAQARTIMRRVFSRVFGRVNYELPKEKTLVRCPCAAS